LEAESAQARDVLNAYFDFLATGADRADLVARLASLRPGTLSPLADQLEKMLPSDENRPNWEWVATYDPTRDIARVTVPVLLMFGDRDTQHPTALATERWQQSLKQAGNDRFTLMVFPGAGHGIRMGEHGRSGGTPFAPGYEDVQRGWLWRMVVDDGNESN
jgi:pimeloyl-ACP methyl ester carboxylesterase